MCGRDDECVAEMMCVSENDECAAEMMCVSETMIVAEPMDVWQRQCACGKDDVLVAETIYVRMHAWLPRREHLCQGACHERLLRKIKQSTCSAAKPSDRNHRTSPVQTVSATHEARRQGPAQTQQPPDQKRTPSPAGSVPRSWRKPVPHNRILRQRHA